VAIRAVKMLAYRHNNVLARGKRCGGGSLSRLWARVSRGRSLRWRSNRGGPIVWIGCLPLPAMCRFNVAFFDELRRRGFIEGQNLTIDFRAFTTHLDLISQYAAELVTARPDAIYCPDRFPAP